MAKLTESYLRNMIKQVMNEMTQDDIQRAKVQYGGTPTGDKTHHIAAAVDEWRLSGDATLAEIASLPEFAERGVTAYDMEMFLKQEDEEMAKLGDPDEVYNDLMEARKRKLAQKRR
jgi:hypothetical protein